MPAGGQLSLAGAGEAQVPGWHARLILFLSALIRLLSERGKSSVKTNGLGWHARLILF